MGTLNQTSYRVTVQSISWTSGQSLASLVDGEWTDLSDEEDNDTDNDLFVDLYLDLGSAAFTGTDSEIRCYLVPSVDGTAFGNWTGNVTTEQQGNEPHFVGAIPTTGTTAAQDLILRNVLIPPGKYKWGFRNAGGVTLNATNTAEWRPHNLQY